ncbi:hypothetical protein D8X55_04485 [Malacoplasma penetrans]|uniref:Signal-peptide-less P35 lipoprotein homolog n=1 Tax=Malacoplasma penetrans (strain HF-2) TaxID=272633 RepID=Q8EV62_MALP2|nr:P35 family lipoprotein [Malacoplasma penetrans]RXY96193.1 hypothetical protein D8X55_04485 [Malacoplasma penetrans]BAC44498.1 signal-peptide-less P35 lipoprotein homolog [Malacoplasma penetrans HF-2]
MKSKKDTKSKKGKFWKILAITGIFTVSAATPIALVSKYVIFKNSSNGNSNNNNNNGGGNTNPQNQTITPKLKSSINLSGSIDKIYSSQNSSDTKTLIAQEIKNNLDSAFENSEELKSVNNLNISVEGDFGDNSSWAGIEYSGTNGWSSTVSGNEVLYSTDLNTLNISSLNDLKYQLTDAKIKEILNASDSSKLKTNAEYTVKNKPGFTSNNLIHINVFEILGSSVKNLDLQIPYSSVNFNISNMQISVSGDNVQTTNATTTLNYNVAINTETNSTQIASRPTATASEISDVNKVLVKLGFAEIGSDNNVTLNQKALQEELGIYNVVFSNASIAPSGTTTDGQSGAYKISFDATPIANKGFVWEDGTSTAKSVSFDVNVDVGNITPDLNQTINLTGSVSKIFDTTTTSGTRKDTNTVIAEDIKANPENYFSNGSDLKTISDLAVTVNGNFPTSTWTGSPYETWKSTVTSTNVGIYSPSLPQLNISSLSDLKTKINQLGIYNVLLTSGLTYSGATFAFQNELGFTDDDLLHVCVRVTSTYGNVNVDLGIPLSSINLTVSALAVSVNGTGVQTLTNGNTNYTYNIGIDDTVNFTKPTTVSPLTEENKTNVNEALVSLGFATKNTNSNPNTYTLDSTKISKALGVYNCTFEGIAIQEDSANNYTITLKATPNANYNWDSGTNESRELTFKVDLASS